MAFGVGRLFHVIHVTDDIRRLDQWYCDVFGARRWLDIHYSGIEMRDGSIVCVGDVPIEPMATVARDGAERTPIGRFSAKVGPHLHSIAWYVEGADELLASMVRQGVRVVSDGGRPPGSPGTSGALYTHPRDTCTQLEFYPGEMRGDPRLGPDWSPSWWATDHPLGISGLSHLTIVVGDLDRAVALYTDGLGGRLVREDESHLTGTKEAYVRVGEETVVALSTPTTDHSLAADDHARNGDILHALTFRVADLDRAEAHLRRHGVGVHLRDDATLVADPADTFGAVLGFTVRPPDA
jgi:catechol 2,3-dioxygenase-like lactoylglutathione lyase family enzyme